jgi:hypothetical protein
MRLHPERGELGEGGLVIDMEYASNAQPFRDRNEHRCVVDEDGPSRWRLGNVESKPKDLNVRLAQVNETGRDERIDKPVELKGANAVCINLARLIADHNDFEVVP